MYKNKIAVSLKHDGKPLLEKGDTFFLPFNKHYSVFIKNLNDKAAAYVDIFINGTHVIQNKRIKPGLSQNFAHSEQSGHSFLFVEKTLSLQKNKPADPEDSLVRVEVRFEEELKFEDTFTTPGKGGFRDEAFFDDRTYINRQDFDFNKDQIMCSSQIPIFGSVSNSVSRQGVTVAGKINKDSIVSAEEKQKGFLEEVLKPKSKMFNFILKIEEAIEVVTKATSKKSCPTCEKEFKGTYSFCPYDGTFLND